jgi:crossover junction endodeoxyribonuclease RuvC
MQTKELVLGMDLSLTCPAFVVGYSDNGKVTIVHHSHVKTKAKDSHGARLRMIFNHLESLLEKYPDIKYLVREKGFSRHAVATQTLFKVVGISDLIANHFGYDEVAEVAPTTVKKFIAGSGKADKEEVLSNLDRFLNIPIVFENLDESDATGVLITFLIQKKLLV